MPEIVHDVIRSPGEPLDAVTRDFMESRFGRDFSAVRVHADVRAAESSSAINAVAYTVGQNIVFGTGQYRPRNPIGQKLLAHELAHTVQQRGASTSGALMVGDTSDPAEHEAHAAEQIVADPSPVRLSSMATATARRQPPPGAGAAPRRVVYLDANVFDQINRGNRAAANALRNLLNAGADVRVPPAMYNEMVNDPAIPRTASANRLVLQELGVQQGAAPTTAQRVGVYAENPAQGGVSFKDAQLVASARAGNAEIWSFDRAFRLNGRSVEASFNVRVAPESSGIPLVEGVQDYRVGRALLGLEQVEISLSGAVTRIPPGGGTPPPAAGGGAPSPGGAVGQAGGGTPAGGAAPTAQPAEFSVQTRFTIRNVTQLAGNTVAEVEVAFGTGLTQMNGAAAANGRTPLPAQALIRVIVNAEGALIGAEGMSGESAAVAETLARQIVASIPRGPGAAQAAAGAAAGAARVSPWIRGIGWAGLVLFVGVTGYQYSQATAEERPRVLTTAAGGFAGGMLSSYVICNLVLGIETVGWSLLICGFVAGIPGGVAGSAIAGDVYDEATATPLQRALRGLESLSPNVRRLFYAMVESATIGRGGLPITPEFVAEFVLSVPGNLSNEELATLTSQLQPVARTDTLDGILRQLRRAIQSLPGRRPIELPPMLNITDVMSPTITGPFRLDALGSGRIRLLPPERPPGRETPPGDRSPSTRTILEVEL